MNIQQILNVSVIIIAVISVLLAVISFWLYLPTSRQSTKSSRVERTNQDLQKLKADGPSKENDQAIYKFNKDNWKSLEEIIAGIRMLSLARPGADSAFLSIVQVLLSSLLQSLDINKKQTPFPDYENISFMIMINDTDESILYSKGWKHESVSEKELYKGDVTIARDENEYFEYRFTGTGINCFVGVRPSQQTVVDIFFDQDHVQEKKIAASPILVQQSVFQRTNLERKEHVIKVVLKEGELALDAIGIYS